MSIPVNINDLENELQRINREHVKLPEDEVKEANEILQDILLNKMESSMKNDEVFKELYKKPQYAGSYYENLKIETPREFDINLVLELPIEKQYISIDTTLSNHGFTRIKVKEMFKERTPDRVKDKVLKWIKDGYFCRMEFSKWFHGIVIKAVNSISPGDIEITRVTESGPAMTLEVTRENKKYSVDLVPVFRFEDDKWPPSPVRQLDNLPRNLTVDVEWCVVPKAPRGASDNKHWKISDDCQWRMSFYIIEKNLMRDLNSMKPAIKLLKLIRDKENWKALSSYYIKTLFMWEQEIQKDNEEFWKKGRLAYVFWHMLNKLEKCLHEKEIKFFWHEKCNLIAHLNEDLLKNMEGRVSSIRKILENGLNKDLESHPLAEAVDKVFKKTSSSETTSSPSQPEEEDSELPIHNGQSDDDDDDDDDDYNIVTFPYQPSKSYPSEEFGFNSTMAFQSSSTSPHSQSEEYGYRYSRTSTDYSPCESSQETSTDWVKVALGVGLATVGVAALIGGIRTVLDSTSTSDGSSNSSSNNNNNNNTTRRRIQ